MNKRDFLYRACLGAVIGTFAAVALFNNTAVAADVSPDSLKLAPGVVKAPEGYETPATTYIVANGTNVYSGHAFYDTKVTGELKLASAEGEKGSYDARHFGLIKGVHERRLPMPIVGNTVNARSNSARRLQASSPAFQALAPVGLIGSG
jgi:hypothetical protein